MSQFSYHRTQNTHPRHSNAPSANPNPFHQNSGYAPLSRAWGSYMEPTHPSYGFTNNDVDNDVSFLQPGYDQTIPYGSQTISAFSPEGSDHNKKDLVDNTQQMQLRSPYPATEEEDSDSEDSAPPQGRNDRRGAQGTLARRRSWMREADDRFAETCEYRELIESVFDLEYKEDGLKFRIRRLQEELSEVQTDLGLVQDELHEKYSGWLKRDGYSELDQNRKKSFEVPLLLDEKEDLSDEEKGIQVIQRGSHVIEMTHTPGQPLQIAITSNDRHVPQNDHSSVAGSVTGPSPAGKHGGRVSKIPVRVRR